MSSDFYYQYSYAGISGGWCVRRYKDGEQLPKYQFFISKKEAIAFNKEMQIEKAKDSAKEKEPETLVSIKKKTLKPGYTYNPQDTKLAFEIIKNAMKADGLEKGSYAQSWHDIISCCVQDELGDKIWHSKKKGVGDRAAGRFMKMTFDMETYKW